MPLPSILLRFAPVSMLLALAVTAPAQTPGIGTRTVAWLNTSGQGSPTLAATVRYPATSTGIATPVLPHPRGWPVIVFLHGYGVLGLDYSTLADAWVEAGYAVVLQDTCPTDPDCQVHDGRALHDAVIGAIYAAGGVFQYAFDSDRIVLAGHSMGGTGIAAVMANNPGYRCGLAISPVMPPTGDASPVTTPFGVIAGLGDTLTPPPSHAEPFYASASGFTGLKFLYLMDATVGHLDLVAFTAGQPPQPQFARTVAVSTGFFDHVLGLAVDGLERAIGPDALQESLLSSLQFATTEPQMWLADELQIGHTTRISIAAEPLGIAILAAAHDLGPAIPTPFGTLRIDPASLFIAAVGLTGPDRRGDLTVPIANDPALIGLRVALQGAGATLTESIWLGSAAGMHVAR